MIKDISDAEERRTITNEIPGMGKCLRKTGDAYVDDEALCFVINLFVLPRQEYFLVKHPYKYNEYVLYSWMRCGAFAKPIGVGRTVPGTNYVKVDFHDLKLTFYMHFAPGDTPYLCYAA